MNSPVYDKDNPANNYFVSGTNFDTDHPNAAGHTAMAASFSQQIKQLIGR